jgi:hypothetical protein
MSIARIKQEAQKADQMIRDMAEQAQRKPEGEQEAAQKEEAPETAQGDDQQEATEDQGTTQVGDDQGQQSGDDGAPDTSAQAPSEEEDWKHKYLSLNGMLRQRDQRIDQLRDMIAAMQHAQTTQAAEKDKAQEQDNPLVTKEDETAFGADLIDLSRRVVKEEFRALREDFLKELRGLQGKVEAVETTAKQTAQERFESKMDQSTPQWRTIDQDPEFVDWLRASETRWNQWAQAVHRLDHVAAGDLIDMYASIKSATQRKQAGPAEARKAQLEKQLAPGKSKSVDTSAKQAEEKKTWTRSEIARLYAESRNMPPAEFAKYEREIADAQREGRVDYSR